MTDDISPFLPSPPKKSNAILWKVLMMAGLILGLLIPLFMISGIISERQGNKQQVEEEIAQTWASEQVILGPVLAIPYKNTYNVTDEAGKKQVRSTRNIAYLLPEQYQVKTHINPEPRYRGIYQAIVYTSKLTAQGNFSLKTLEELHIAKESILWKEAFVVVGIPSMKGVNKKPGLTLLGKSSELLPGMNGASLSSSGLYSPLSLSGNETSLPFKLALSLKGSQTLSVIPIGKQNTITMDSGWQSPSFIGSTLPTSRQIGEQGFTATWDVPYFARSYGQALLDASDLQLSMNTSAVGVQLLTPVDSYRQSERAVKYGVLFLVLTFATYFLFEVISRYRLHPFQYLLVGCAISLFYLLLIAISEVTQFGLAYGIASVGTISVITLYSKAILGKIRRHAQWIITALLAILYIYLYVLLQLEDMSLLFGAIGLFIVLAVIMYVTRNIDWYSEQTNA